MISGIEIASAFGKLFLGLSISLANVDMESQPM